MQEGTESDKDRCKEAQRDAERGAEMKGDAGDLLDVQRDADLSERDTDTRTACVE